MGLVVGGALSGGFKQPFMLLVKMGGGHLFIFCCHSPFSRKARELADKNFAGLVVFLSPGFQTLPGMSLKQAVHRCAFQGS